jgi:ankyrin repeat protein
MLQIASMTTRGMIDKRDKRGDTALHVAARHENLDACRVLVNAGASIETKNAANEKPQDLARHAMTRDFFRRIHSLTES